MRKKPKSVFPEFIENHILEYVYRCYLRGDHVEMISQKVSLVYEIHYTEVEINEIIDYLNDLDI